METEAPPRKSRVPYRIILASIWLTIASAAALGLLYRLRDLVFHLVVAAFIAMVLNPIVLRLQRIGFSRGPAILAATAAFFLLFLGIGATVAAPITSQGVSFARRAPGYLRQAQEGKGPVGTFARRFHLQKQLSKAVPAIDRYLSKLPAQVVGLLRSAASTAFSVAIVVILALFMLIEGPAFVGAFMAGVPPGRKESVRAVGETASRVVSGYTIGVVILAVLSGIVTADRRGPDRDRPCGALRVRPLRAGGHRRRRGDVRLPAGKEPRPVPPGGRAGSAAQRPARPGRRARRRHADGHRRCAAGDPHRRNLARHLRRVRPGAGADVPSPPRAGRCAVGRGPQSGPRRGRNDR